MYNLISFLTQTKALLIKNQKYYVASFAESCSEVLVFPAREDGTIIDFHEVDGSRGYFNLFQFLDENTKK